MMNNKQKLILRLLQAAIEQSGAAAAIEKNPGTEDSALYAEYPGIGENDRNMIVTVTFLPPFLPKADASMDCMIQILISDEIPEQTYPALKQGVSILNYLTTRGGFIMTPDCTGLMYRNTINFKSDQDSEDISKTILYHIASGLSITDIWADTFYDVIEGRMSFEQFVHSINSYVTEEEQL